MRISDAARRLPGRHDPKRSKAARTGPVLAALVTLAMLTLPTATALAVPAGWDVVRIPTHVDSLDLSGDRVVWATEGVGGHPGSVYAYDLGHTGSLTLLSSSAESLSGVRPKISGTRVVWPQKGAVGDDTDIFLYDLSTGGPAVDLTADTVWQRDPDIFGNTVVWVDRDSLGASWDIAAFDLRTGGPRRVISDPVGGQETPSLNGRRVVWTTGAVARVYGIGYRALASTTPAQWLTDSDDEYWHTHPGVADYRAVWSSRTRGGGPPAPGKLVGVVVAGLFGTPAPIALTGNGWEPAISGPNVVWTGLRSAGGDTDIFFVQLGVSPAIVNLSQAPGDQYSPVVDVLPGGRTRVAWASSTNEIVVATRRLPTTSFRDVPASHEYSTAISALAAEGIVSGYELPGDEYEFRPGNTIMRGQFAKIIVGSLGLPVDEKMTSPFLDFGVPDVSDNLYPQEFVASAWMNGITTGVTSTKFDPWRPINRAQMVTMTVRAVQRVEPGLLDDPPPGYRGNWSDFGEPHTAYARIAEYNHLLAGLPLTGAASNPLGAMPRGEAAQVIRNMMQLLK